MYLLVLSIPFEICSSTNTPHIIFLTSQTFQGGFTASVAQTACENQAIAYGLLGSDVSPVLPAITEGSCAKGLCLATKSPTSRLVIGITGEVLGTLGTFVCNPTEYQNNGNVCPHYESTIGEVLGDCSSFWGFSGESITFGTSFFFGTEDPLFLQNCNGWTSSIEDTNGGFGSCSATSAANLFNVGQDCSSSLKILCIHAGPTHSPTQAPSTSLPTSSPSSSKPSRSPTRSPSLSPSTSKPSFAPSKTPTVSLPTKSPSRSPSSSKPSSTPSLSPSFSAPSRSPSISPSISSPTSIPSYSVPSAAPTASNPTSAPTDSIPTRSPSVSPSKAPIPPTFTGSGAYIDPNSLTTIAASSSAAGFIFIVVCAYLYYRYKQEYKKEHRIEEEFKNLEKVEQDLEAKYKELQEHGKELEDEVRRLSQKALAVPADIASELKNELEGKPT